MHRALFIRALAIVLILGWMMLRVVPATVAHNGPPRIELGAERIAPGVALEVRGVNIAPEQPVRLTLVGGGQEFALGTFVGDEHGDFTQIVTVPRDAPAGAYIVRVIGPNRLILAIPLAIVGTADEDEGAQRDQDEPLLAPMPRAQPAAPVVAASPAVATATAPQESQISPWPAVGLVALAAVAGLAIMARQRAASALK